jgi:hypothetical protein
MRCEGAFFEKSMANPMVKIPRTLALVTQLSALRSTVCRRTKDGWLSAHASRALEL